MSNALTIQSKVNMIDQSTFDQLVLKGQELQKRNPFGSELHRKGYEIVRQAVIGFFGEDKLGEYGSW